MNIWKQGTGKSPRDSEYSDTDIAELCLSVRSYNCLKRAGCMTVGDVIRLIESDEKGLRRIRNLGSRSEAEILQAVEPFRNAKAPAPGLSGSGRIIRQTVIRPAKTVWDSDIEDFHLSDESLTRLKQSGIRRVRDLYAANIKNEPGWYAVRELFEKIPADTAS